MSAVSLLCPVRGCGLPLSRGAGAFSCPRGHRFDLARSGYCNLLQPQERRSRRPGDSAAALAARRRLFDRGHGSWLMPHLLAAFDALGLPPRAAVLDVGCGEGFYLGSLAREREIEAHGLDISAPAVDLAARRYPGATWIVANADRSLPYPAASFSLALSLTSRLHPSELRRVLAAPAPPTGAQTASADLAGARPATGGLLLLAVPAADDLVELRAAVLGEGRLRDRLQPALSALGAAFDLISHTTARVRLRLEAPDLHDLLAATYRGPRPRAATRRGAHRSRGDDEPRARLLAGQTGDSMSNNPIMERSSAGPRLIIVCGLPGSGKTALAKRLADRLRAIRFSPDEWMNALSLDLYDEVRRGKIEALQWQLAQYLLVLGQTVIIEWGTWARSERDTLRTGARALGAAVELHHLSAPPDVLFDRIRRRGRENPPIERDAVLRWSEIFQVPTPEEKALFDEPALLEA